MTISSRTPEGLPHRCPICGEASALEPSFPGGDACCPACGQLLCWFQQRLGLTSYLSLSDLLSAELMGADSMDTVELMMELEERFDIDVPEDVGDDINTIEDAIRYIRKHRNDDAA